MEQRKRKIKSIEELQKVVPVIVKAVNGDQQLALRALANPLLAAEELGYDITPEVQLDAQRRIRFNPEVAERLSTLEAEIHNLAGEKFEIDNPHTLGEMLFEKLKLQTPEIKEGLYQIRGVSGRVPVDPLPPVIFGRPHIPDPLDVLRDAHPVIGPLLEYRRLEASAARLASRENYERIKNQDVKLPVVHVQAHLKRKPKPE